MLLSTPRVSSRRSLLNPLRLHLADLSVRCSSDEHDARLHQSQASQLWRSLVTNALPLQTTERHLTVGWCQEVSRNVLASRHLAVAGTRCFRGPTFFGQWQLSSLDSAVSATSIKTASVISSSIVAKFVTGLQQAVVVRCWIFFISDVRPKSGIFFFQWSPRFGGFVLTVCTIHVGTVRRQTCEAFQTTHPSIRGFTAAVFTSNALPIRTTERHITVRWCKEVSRTTCFQGISSQRFPPRPRHRHFEQYRGEDCQRSSASMCCSRP